MNQKTALIVVDLNNDFMPGGALAVESADEVLAPINRLAENGGYDYIVATQDWHPPDHNSFKTWPVHCVAGTVGADFHPLFKMEFAHALVRKGFRSDRDSYSGFYDERGDSNGLAELLHARRITHVDVVGIATDYCVKATAIEAAKRAGFRTRVLLFACRGVGLNPQDIPGAIEEIRAAGVEIVSDDPFTPTASIPD
jgi:nicotinamidase/pyrazinamidase